MVEKTEEVKTKSNVDIDRQWFKDVVLQALEESMLSVEDLIKQYSKLDEIDNLKQESRFINLLDAYSMLNIVPLSNTTQPNLNQIPVLRQFRGALCGFYMLYHAKQVISSLVLAKNRSEQLGYLCKQQSSHYFWEDYHRIIDILLACDDVKFVNKQDKQELVVKQSPMERSHLRWLFQKDKHLLMLKQKAKEKSIELFIDNFETSINVINLTIEAILDVNKNFNSFKISEKQSIYVMLLGVVNHWVVLIAYKQSKELDSTQKITWFLYDSSNMVHLDKHETQQLVEVCEQRVRDKIKCGLKPSGKFVTKMTVYSLLDQKFIFQKLMHATQIKNDNSILLKLYTNSYIHNAFKNFHSYMETFRPTASTPEQSKTDLKLPSCLLFPQVPKLGGLSDKSPQNQDIVKVSKNQEQDLGYEWNIDELEYPYKELVTDFSYLTELKDETHGPVYEMIIFFMKGCHRPVDISNQTIRYIDTMGVKSIFQQDLLLMQNWTKSFIKFHDKLHALEGVIDEKKKDEQNYNLYGQLMQVVYKLNDLLAKNAK